MNKLAIFAISALLILGGFSWFAAKNSFVQYKTQYQQEVNQQQLGFTMDIGDVQIYNKTGQAHSEKLTLTFDSISGSPSVSFIDAKVQFDPKTFKKEVIQITQISAESMQLTLPAQQPQQALTEMLSLLASLTAQAAQKQVGLNNGKEAIVAIQQSTMTSVHISLMAQGAPVHEHIISSQSLTPTTQGSPLSWQLVVLAKEWLEQVSANFPQELAE